MSAGRNPSFQAPASAASSGCHPRACARATSIYDPGQHPVPGISPVERLGTRAGGEARTPTSGMPAFSISSTGTSIGCHGLHTLLATRSVSPCNVIYNSPETEVKVCPLDCRMDDTHTPENSQTRWKHLSGCLSRALASIHRLLRLMLPSHISCGRAQASNLDIPTPARPDSQRSRPLKEPTYIDSLTPGARHLLYPDVLTPRVAQRYRLGVISLRKGTGFQAERSDPWNEPREIVEVHPRGAPFPLSAWANRLRCNRLRHHTL